MPIEYLLYQIKNYQPSLVAEPSTKGKRVFIFGGLNDLGGNCIDKSSWKAFDRTLGHTYEGCYVYTIGESPSQSWHEDMLLEKTLYKNKHSPTTSPLTKQIFNLPEEISEDSRKKFIGKLEYLAENTVILSYSAGGVLTQHINQRLVQFMKDNGCLPEEISRITKKVKCVNVATVHRVASNPEQESFEQITFLNPEDTNAAITPYLSLYWDEICDIANLLEEDYIPVEGEKKPQFLCIAYMKYNDRVSLSGINVVNPNLGVNIDPTLGYIKKGRDLIVYGAVTNEFPSSIINPRTSPTAEPDSHPVWAHKLCTNLNYPATTIGNGKRNILTQQRFTAAPLIQNAVSDFVNGYDALQHIEEIITTKSIEEAKKTFAMQVENSKKILSPRMPR